MFHKCPFSCFSDSSGSPLNSNLDVKVITLSQNSGSLNGYTCTAHKIGNVVYINGHVNPKVTGENMILLGSAPVPKSDTDIYFPLGAKQSTAYGYGRISKGENTLKFTTSEAGVNYVFGFSYVVD